jgi:hypothetical protein
MKKLLLILPLLIVSCATQQKQEYFSIKGNQSDVSGNWKYAKLDNEFDGSWERASASGVSSSAFSKPYIIIDTSDNEYTVLIRTGEYNCTYGVQHTLELAWKNEEKKLNEVVDVWSVSEFGRWSSDSRSIIIEDESKNYFLWKLNYYDELAVRYQPCYKGKRAVIRLDISGKHNIKTIYKPEEET